MLAACHWSCQNCLPGVVGSCSNASSTCAVYPADFSKLQRLAAVACTHNLCKGCNQLSSGYGCHISCDSAMVSVPKKFLATHVLQETDQPLYNGNPNFIAVPTGEHTGLWGGATWTDTLGMLRGCLCCQQAAECARDHLKRAEEYSAPAAVRKSRALRWALRAASVDCCACCCCC
jgi:hypothetical protein